MPEQLYTVLRQKLWYKMPENFLHILASSHMECTRTGQINSADGSEQPSEAACKAKAKHLVPQAPGSNAAAVPHLVLGSCSSSSHRTPLY